MPKDRSDETLNVRLNGPDEVWHHLHGVIPKPKGWVFVAKGDAGLTRSLKSRQHWLVQERPKTPTGRRGAVQDVGLLVPPTSLKQAGGKAKKSAAKVGAKARKQDREIKELEDAVYKFLKFRREHMKLARTIAKEAAKASAQVGSGSVGRTKTLALGERAELCARAHIRHVHTDYEARIESGKKKGAKRMSKTSVKYKTLKAEAHREVDTFLAKHRKSA